MGEKREKPTPQKLKKAREQGNIVASSELVFAFLFCGGVLLLWGMHALFYTGFKKIFVDLFSSQHIEGALFRAFSPILIPLLLVFLGLFSLAAGGHLFQRGWVWRRKKRGKGQKRIFFPLIQWGCAAILGYVFLKNFGPSSDLILATSEQKGVLFFQKTLFLSLALSGILILLGGADFAYQKWCYLKQMHMTPQELKEEKKENERNPQIRSRQRRL